MSLIPDPVRNKALNAGLSWWVDGLPSLIAELEETWHISTGPAYQTGTEAYVAPARTDDGLEVVLKLLLPRDSEAAHNEITALRLANGESCAQLLRDDPDRGAMLLERLGPPLSSLDIPIGERHEILCDAAVKVWRPASDSGLPTGADKGKWLSEYIAETWETLDRPCSERAIAYARACAERRIAAHDDEHAVLVHGDIHQWNALKADSGYKLVDPDGLLAEPEYDLGIIMREDPEELMQGDPHERSRWLASRTNLDETAIWEWGVVERVSTGLVLSKIDLQPVGRQMLAAADFVAV
jgi:streptomycin 6-kinase